MRQLMAFHMAWKLGNLLVIICVVEAVFGTLQKAQISYRELNGWPEYYSRQKHQGTDQFGWASSIGNDLRRRPLDVERGNPCAHAPGGRVVDWAHRRETRSAEETNGVERRNPYAHAPGGRVVDWAHRRETRSAEETNGVERGNPNAHAPGGRVVDWAHRRETRSAEETNGVERGNPYAHAPGGRVVDWAHRRETRSAEETNGSSGAFNRLSYIKGDREKSGIANRFSSAVAHTAPEEPPLGIGKRKGSPIPPNRQSNAALQGTGVKKPTNRQYDYYYESSGDGNNISNGDGGTGGGLDQVAQEGDGVDGTTGDEYEYASGDGAGEQAGDGVSGNTDVEYADGSGDGGETVEVFIPDSTAATSSPTSATTSLTRQTAATTTAAPSNTTPTATTNTTSTAASSSTSSTVSTSVLPAASSSTSSTGSTPVSSTVSTSVSSTASTQSSSATTTTATTTTVSTTTFPTPINIAVTTSPLQNIFTTTVGSYTRGNLWLWRGKSTGGSANDQTNGNPFGQISNVPSQNSNAFGQINNPFGQINTPQDQAFNPFGQISTPQDQAFNPFGQNNYVPSQTSNPFGQVFNVPSQTANPFGQISDAASQSTNNIGQNYNLPSQTINDPGQNGSPSINQQSGFGVVRISGRGHEDTAVEENSEALSRSTGAISSRMGAPQINTGLRMMTENPDNNTGTETKEAVTRMKVKRKRKRMKKRRRRKKKKVITVTIAPVTTGVQQLEEGSNSVTAEPQRELFSPLPETNGNKRIRRKKKVEKKKLKILTGKR